MKLAVRKTPDCPNCPPRDALPVIELLCEHGFAFPVTDGTVAESVKIGKAVELIVAHGNRDGEQHKQWVLDQVLRTLSGGIFSLDDPGTAP